jgi:hypothetical protein
LTEIIGKTRNKCRAENCRIDGVIRHKINKCRLLSGDAVTTVAPSPDLLFRNGKQ